MSASPPAQSSEGKRAGSLLAALVICAAIGLGWANTWTAPFVFDDTSSIVENQSLHHFASFAWLRPPHALGETVGGRPMLNLTFALNYAISGLAPWSYHGFNLLIHGAAALALWGILRRLSVLGSGIAFSVALLWAVHPLQTAAVTYVVQRAESLAALCILLCVYGYLRFVSTAAASRARWAAFSVSACAFGVGVKETVVVAPLLCLLLDATLLSAGFRAAWRQRRALLLALASTWLVLAGLVGGNLGRGGSAGWGGAVDVFSYALTQVWALTHYLRLAVWPAGLTFDYGVLLVREPAALVWPALLVGGGLSATLWALRRRHTAGVAGAVFFLLLAPTSSVVPVATQTVAEHRMYLALAPLLVLLVAGAARVRARLHAPASLAIVALASVALAFGATTFVRNTDYRSARTLWQDTVAERPENPRARYNLGLALLGEGHREAALTQFRRAVELQPAHAYAQFQLGVAALADGDLTSAETHFSRALAADPAYIDARVNLAQTHARAGRPAAAVAEYETALRAQPAADIRTNLAALYLQLGRNAEAENLLQLALSDAPELAEAHFYLARVRERGGALGAAEEELRAALRARPQFVAAAVALGNLLARQERFPDAIPAYRAALANAPAEHQVRNNLANCYLALSRFPEAIAEYEVILAARPDDATVRQNLAVAREMAAHP